MFQNILLGLNLEYNFYYLRLLFHKAKQEGIYCKKICNSLSKEKLQMICKMNNLKSDFEELDEVKDKLEKEKDRLGERMKN